ncbi:MAG: hypothetical protein ACK5SI_07175 [Planctomycetia bacterium]
MIRSLAIVCLVGAGMAFTTPPCRGEPPAGAAVAEKPVAAQPAGLKPAGARVGYTLIIFGPEMDAVVKAAGLDGNKTLGGPYLGTWHDLKGAKAIRPGRLDGLERGEFDMLLLASPHCYPNKDSWGDGQGLDSTAAILCATGLKNNPNFRLVWQTWPWPRGDIAEKKLSLPPASAESPPDLRGLEKVADEINAHHGRQVMVISPAAELCWDLARMVADGKFPGITDPFELWVNANMWEPGSHVSTLIHYCNLATMYGVSPIGLKPDFSGIKRGGGKGRAYTFDDLAPITDEQREILQRLAWEKVTSYPYSGVKKP